MACALEFIGNDDTSETRRLIRLADMFFDSLNVKDTLLVIKKWKEFRGPYKSPPT